jgi:hypothetical protein
MMVLRIERLISRPSRMDDAQAIFEAYQPTLWLHAS